MEMKTQQVLTDPAGPVQSDYVLCSQIKDQHEAGERFRTFCSLRGMDLRSAEVLGSVT